MKRWVFILIFFSEPLWALSVLKLNKDRGQTNFLAQGNPSAIRIDGKGEGPEGEFKITEKGENLVLTGSLKVNLNTYETGIALRDRHMKEKYLEVGQFQEAVLTVQELVLPKKALNQEGDSKGPFKGTLNLHGIQKDVQGEFSLKFSFQEGLKMSAGFQMKLSDFGISVPSFAGITVADRVEVTATSSPEKIQ